MVAAAVAAWAISGDVRRRRLSPAPPVGVIVAFVLALSTYFLIVRRLQTSRAIREEEKEIFILTATLLWGIMIQEAIAYFFTNNAKTVLPIVEGVVSDRRRAHARQRDFHRARLLGWPSAACGCSSIGRQGGQGAARGVDEPARRHAARL